MYSTSLKSIIFNLIKRIFRSKILFMWLITLFLIYYFFINFINDKNHQLNNDNLNKNEKMVINKLQIDQFPKQIDAIKDRIDKLEDSIANSNKNAQELNNLIVDFKENNIKNINQLIKQNNDNSYNKLNNKNNHSNVNGKIAVLVMSCNRPNSVENHLNQLIEKRALSNSVNKFSIIVSQDCNHLETAKSIEKYSTHLFASIKQPDQSEITQSKDGTIPIHLRGYFKIARHYKWALDQIFLKYSFSSVVITEDDLNIAVDFFDYFEAMHKILANDSSLFCVSAWNDNGKKDTIDLSKPDLVHRSDFFPGLGWMMLKSFWVNELREKWPPSYWDDWLRDKDQRKNRACLRPEISRTEMAIQYARNGVSNGQFLDSFISKIILNKSPIKWLEKDNSYLLKNNFDRILIKEVYNNSIEVSYLDYLQNSAKYNSDSRSIRLIYNSKDEFIKYANFFGIMNDFKCGVPRTGYRGVVRVYFNSKTIYIAPYQKLAWTGYDLTY